MVEEVRAYYDARVDEEWHRLEASWLEHAVTRHFVARYLPPAATILDVGAGPGRYAIDLAAAGHAVDLVDLAPVNVEAARHHAAERGVALRRAEADDARDLGAFPAASYDAVLCLGPLYHLLDEEDRARAVSACLRVLKPGGVGFFAFISRYASLHFVAKTIPADVVGLRPVLDRVVETGVYRTRPGEDFFTESNALDPATIRPFMARFAIEPLVLFGAEGPFAQSEARLGALAPAARQAWLDLAIAQATTPAALYGSEHLVFVGRKPG